MKRLVLALLVGSSSAFAADAPKPPLAPEAPKPVLTADEGRKLYELGVKTGAAQATMQAEVRAAQQDVKPILDKLAPASKP